MTQILNMQSLPSNDNINPFAFCVDVTKEYIIQKGKMIAYYGNLRFESFGSSVLDVLIGEAFNSPLYAQNYIVVSGHGKLILGDNENHLNSFDLDNANMTIKANHLLAFEPTLSCQDCVIPGYLTLLGTGKMLASSNGQVHFMEPPVKVDEQALLGWADCPTPSYRHDYAYIKDALSLVAHATGLSSSGEEKQVNFTGQGTVLVQSSEEALQGRLPLQSLLAQISGLHQNDLQQVKDTVVRRLGER